MSCCSQRRYRRYCPSPSPGVAPPRRSSRPFQPSRRFATTYSLAHVHRPASRRAPFLPAPVLPINILPPPSCPVPSPGPVPSPCRSSRIRHLLQCFSRPSSRLTCDDGSLLSPGCARTQVPPVPPLGGGLGLVRSLLSFYVRNKDAEYRLLHHKS